MGKRIGILFGYTKAFCFLLFVSGILLSLLVSSTLVSAEVKKGDTFENSISYLEDWGPNILDPDLGGEIIEVSSNGTHTDGKKTLNDGLATEGHHWEPLWEEPPYYLIVKLKQAASVARIQFTTYSEGKGYPKVVTIIPMENENKSLGKGRELQLDNNPIQRVELTKPLPEARLLRFEFDEDTYLENQLEIGEIALFEASFIHHIIAPGSEKQDRIKFERGSGDEIFGDIKFPDNLIKIKRKDGSYDIELDKIYGLRLYFDSLYPSRAQILLWSGEIVTGTMDTLDNLTVNVDGQEWQLQFNQITEIGLAKRKDKLKKSEQYEKQKKNSEMGVLELISGDKFYVDSGSLKITLESSTTKGLAENVPLKNLAHIEKLEKGETSHLIIYKNNEIIYANLKEDATLEVKLLADIVRPVTVRQNEILSYQELSRSIVKHDKPFDVLALRRGDLVIGQLLDGEIEFRSPNLKNNISLNTNSILSIRSKIEQQGQVEILLTNGSKLKGKVVSGSLQFKRGEENTTGINIQDLGVLQRFTFTKEELKQLEAALNKGSINQVTTDVALYLFRTEENFNTVARMMDNVFIGDKVMDLWSFYPPGWGKDK